MAKNHRPPVEIITAIDSKASKVREVAAALTQRIAQFEVFLSKLHGRVESLCFGPHPDYHDHRGEPTPYQLALKFHREGKEWIISYSTYDTRDDEFSGEFEPLKEASLKIKIGAIKLFPELLAAIEGSQDQLVVDISKANEEFDAFSRTLIAPAAKKERAQ